MAPNGQFNILIVGSTGVGKTTYINRIRKGDFSTSEDEGIPYVRFDTSTGRVKINMYECTTVEELKVPIHGAIVMFDANSQITYNVVETFHTNIRDIYGAIPVVLCGNKVDCGKAVRPRFHRHMVYFDLSVKSNYNFQKPFIYLIQNLVGPATVIV